MRKILLISLIISINSFGDITGGGVDLGLSVIKDATPSLIWDANIVVNEVYLGIAHEFKRSTEYDTIMYEPDLKIDGTFGIYESGKNISNVYLMLGSYKARVRILAGISTSYKKSIIENQIYDSSSCDDHYDPSRHKRCLDNLVLTKQKDTRNNLVSVEPAIKIGVSPLRVYSSDLNSELIWLYLGWVNGEISASVTVGLGLNKPDKNKPKISPKGAIFLPKD